MPLRVHDESSTCAPWLQKFVKETVDDALSLLGHGQARYACCSYIYDAYSPKS